MDAELLEAMMNFGGLGMVGFVIYWIFVRIYPSFEQSRREDLKTQEDRHRQDRVQWVAQLNTIQESHAAALAELHEQTLQRMERIADQINSANDG